jgi:hypothetical protein
MPPSGLRAAASNKIVAGDIRASAEIDAAVRDAPRFNYGNIL